MNSIAGVSLIPHGYCIAWDPSLLTAFVVGNLLIALSYFAIPLVILRFVRQRTDIDYKSLHWLFAGFIVTCGITHLLHVIELWYPVYYWEAFFDLLTALVSVIAAIMLWRILPALIHMPSAQQLLAANQKLERVSKSLHEKETQLRSLGDSLPNSYLYEYTIEDGKPKFLYLSSGVQRLNGVNAEAALADAMVLLGQVDPEQREEYFRSEAESLRSMTDFSLELRMLHANGGWRWIEVKSRPRLSQGGNVVWDGIATDITDRHLFEAEINRLAQAVEQNPTGILITNAQGELEYMNTACSRITGFQFAQSMGRSRREIISTEMSDEQYVQINAQIEAGKSWSGQLPSRRRDGTLYWEHISVSPIYDDSGKISNYLYLRRDITEQKNAETALQQRSADLARANADLMRFADVSAHHLMEPTRRLSIYAQRLRPRIASCPDLKDDLEVNNSLSTLERESERLRNLVRDIQLYLAAGQPRGDIRQLDANSVMHTVLQHLSSSISESGALISTGVLPPALIDQPRMIDLFSVLLNNALEHGRPLDGSTPFHVAIEGERKEAMSRYSISDNGPGIPPEYRDRVFGIFEKMSPAGTHSGIGLSIAKRIVESRKGNIWIQNSARGGTMVVFELPVGGGA